MVDDKIHHHLHITLLELSDEGVDVLELAVQRINVLVVGDVVPHVRLRTLVHWGAPEYIDSQMLEIVKLGRDSRHIAPSRSRTCSCIKEGCRIDLVDDCLLPPPMLCYASVFTHVAICSGSRNGGYENVVLEYEDSEISTK